MSVRKKGKRKIKVSNQSYLWYVELDYDSPYYIELHSFRLKLHTADFLHDFGQIQALGFRHSKRYAL